MILGKEEIVSLIEAGVSKRIELARKQAHKLNMHLTGKKLLDFLETLDSYENIAQKKLREKLAKSNRSLFSFLLRPTDKIFTAKGGNIQYNLPQERISEFKAQISEVADGLDIKKYLKKVVRKMYIMDPNAVLFIDIDTTGKLETHVETSNEIWWYANKGNKVQAIIFAPFIKEEDKGTTREGFKYFRVIDRAFDRIYIQDGNEIYEDQSQLLDNYFGFVPAMILGDEKSLNEDIFESLISDVVEDADEMLRDVSVKTVHKLAHAYPKYWSYEQECTRCEGEGVVRSLDKDGETIEVECGSCGGEGVKTRTNPSDELVLRTPQEGEPTIAPNVAGYVQPDLETMNFYEESVEKATNKMFRALWGTIFEQSGKKETATGRYIDSQPVQDRLKDISDTFARFHKFMLDCYGKVILSDPNYSTSVSYGTRYILEGPDDILKTYQEASRENISELGILDLRDKYFEAEYQGDNLELTKRKKLAKIEPFPTMKVTEVMSTLLPEREKLRKLYYSTWVSSLSDAQIILLNEKQLRESLEDFISDKALERPKPNLQM